MLLLLTSDQAWKQIRPRQANKYNNKLRQARGMQCVGWAVNVMNSAVEIQGN